MSVLRRFIMLFAKLIMLFNFYLSFFDNKGRYIFQLCKSFAEKFLPPLRPTTALSWAERLHVSPFANANIYTFRYYAKHNTIFFILFFYAYISFRHNYPHTLIYNHSLSQLVIRRGKKITPLNKKTLKTRAATKISTIFILTQIFSPPTPQLPYRLAQFGEVQ